MCYFLFYMLCMYVRQAKLCIVPSLCFSSYKNHCEVTTANVGNSLKYLCELKMPLYYHWFYFILVQSKFFETCGLILPNLERQVWGKQNPIIQHGQLPSKIRCAIHCTTKYCVARNYLHMNHEEIILLNNVDMPVLCVLTLEMTFLVDSHAQ